MSRSPYFLESEPALVAVLDDFLARLAANLERQPFRSSVATLVLGGGYGRGEGGVFRMRETGRAHFYNDLDFCLFVKGRKDAAAIAAWCHRWERDGTAELGIEVEFKRLPADAFRRSGPTMFYHDLLQGHWVVWGDAGVMTGAPTAHRNARLIPLSESARLLFNRGSGLLFARWKLKEEPSDADGFIERNHAKARLALADAVLAAAGRHDGSCVERARRLASEKFPVPANFAQLRAWHAEGVQFKLQPRHRRPGVAALKEAQQELTAAWLDVFLWLESGRLGHDFANGGNYFAWSGRLFPETSRVWNLLLHGRDRIKRGSALPDWFDYPRSSLQRALVAAHMSHLSEADAARFIGEGADSWRAAYRRWWGHYN